MSQEKLVNAYLQAVRSINNFYLAMFWGAWLQAEREKEEEKKMVEQSQLVQFPGRKPLRRKFDRT